MQVDVNGDDMNVSADSLSLTVKFNDLETEARNNYRGIVLNSPVQS